MEDKDHITCATCGFSGNRQFLERSCGNCFACLGCEIYTCPQCGDDIVIRPLQEKRRGTLRNTGDD